MSNSVDAVTCSCDELAAGACQATSPKLCPCKYVPGFSSGGRNALSRESLLVSGWLGPAMSIRAQIARDLKCDERDEESHHHCSERNRAEAGSEESERYEQAYDAQTQAEDRPENTPRRCVLNNACAAQVHRRAAAKRPSGARVE